MIDIHSHLCFGPFDNDIEAVLAECKKRGMKAVIASSARYDEGLKCLELAKKHKDFVFTTLGCHPIEGTMPGHVLELIKKEKATIVGIGEAGLDYHWEKDASKRHAQAKVFSGFIDLAETLQLPLVIHSWDAEQECFDMVKDRNIRAVFHCYSGPRTLAAEIVKRDFFISVSTQVIFSKQHRKLAKDVPLENMLLETDAPWLSPHGRHPEFQPEAGWDPKRNYPWNIILSADKIAELKGVHASEVLKKCGENAIGVFGMKIG